MTPERIIQDLQTVNDAYLLEAKSPVPTKKRTLRPVRIAIAAACLCIALVGGAFAAAQIAGFKSVDIFENLLHEGQRYDGYSLSGGFRFVSLDELSPEIKELSSQNPALTIELPVHTLNEFELLTGLDMEDNPSPSGFLQHGFISSLTSNSKGPTSLSYTVEYRGTEEDSLRLFMNATVYTKQMEDLDLDLSVSYVFPSGREFTPEPYITASGLETLLTHSQYFPTDILFKVYGSDCWYADFVLDGIRYHLVAYCPDDPQSALDTLKQILNAFE